MAPAPDLVSLTLIFCAGAVATVVSRVSTRLVLPTVVVEIVLGILMGPEVLDLANVDPYILFLSEFGLVVLFFLAGIEVIHSGVPKRLLARGFLIPVFFVVTGMQFDIDGLLSGAGLALAALFLAIFLVTRGSAALLSLRELGTRGTAALALFSATGLPLIVAVIEVGEGRGEIGSDVAAAPVGAGMTSVLLYPLLALVIARASVPAASLERA